MVVLNILFVHATRGGGGGCTERGGELCWIQDDRQWRPEPGLWSDLHVQTNGDDLLGGETRSVSDPIQIKALTSVLMVDDHGDLSSVSSF